MFEHKPETIPNNTEQRTFKEILSVDDNGEELIKSLQLDSLKASNDGESDKYTLAHGNAYAENFLKKQDSIRMCLNEYKNDIGDKYKDYPLVDLGSDGNPRISLMAQDLKVKGVIAVDVANQIDKTHLESLKNTEEYVDKNFPVVGLKIDMLELMKQLPDKSCNVSMFSIDHVIITSDTYNTLLMKEIHRVVPEDGLIVSFASNIDQEPKKYLNLFKSAGGPFFKINNLQTNESQ